MITSPSYDGACRSQFCNIVFLTNFFLQACAICQYDGQMGLLGCYGPCMVPKSQVQVYSVKYIVIVFVQFVHSKQETCCDTFLGVDPAVLTVWDGDAEHKYLVR